MVDMAYVLRLPNDLDISLKEEEFGIVWHMFWDLVEENTVGRYNVVPLYTSNVNEVKAVMYDFRMLALIEWYHGYDINTLILHVTHRRLAEMLLERIVAEMCMYMKKVGMKRP